MLKPFVLRRLKSDVLKQLVAKTEKLEKVPLSGVSVKTKLRPNLSCQDKTAGRNGRVDVVG